MCEQGVGPVTPSVPNPSSLLEYTMTLTLAWVRSQNKSEELVVASDSRLRGGYAWDAAPKILTLPRNDAVMAFAGSTAFAYPMIIQAANSVASYDKALDRGQSLEDLKGHLVRVFNGMLNELTDVAPHLDQNEEQALFILAGYSWKFQRFVMWTLYWNATLQAFDFAPTRPWRGGNEEKQLAIVGDELDAAKELLVELLRDKGQLRGGGFDWEPLEVLAKMIRDSRFPSIGGYPQVVKVYKALKVVPFSIPWQRDDGTTVLTAFGRPLLDYETANRIPRLHFDIP